jgi:hypothetical protein
MRLGVAALEQADGAWSIRFLIAPFPGKTVAIDRESCCICIESWHLDLVYRFVEAPFVTWMPESATDALAVLDVTDINRG